MLVVAEEDVAVVDRALHVEDPDLAQAALAATAVVHHVRAACLERLEHRHVACHGRLQAEARDAHAERFGCERPLLPKVSNRSSDGRRPVRAQAALIASSIGAGPQT